MWYFFNEKIMMRGGDDEQIIMNGLTGKKDFFTVTAKNQIKVISQKKLFLVNSGKKLVLEKFVLHVFKRMVMFSNKEDSRLHKRHLIAYSLLLEC